jgi:hypothetical protein
VPFEGTAIAPTKLEFVANIKPVALKLPPALMSTALKVAQSELTKFAGWVSMEASTADVLNVIVSP